MRRKHPDRGAAAVEMAIILPLLLLVIGGLVDFGRAYFTNVVITNAAREGARAAVVGANANSRAIAAANGVSIVTPVSVSYSSLGATDCATAPADTTVTVTVTTTAFSWIILQPALSLFGASGSLPSPLTATANMRCE